MTDPVEIDDDPIASLIAVDRVLPSVIATDGAWQPMPAPMAGMRGFVNRREQLTALVTAARYADGRWWLHFSVAGRTALPSWEQLVRAKEALLGPTTKAVQVLAPRAEWVDIHPRCLHLWVCLDGDPLPDFTRGTRSL